MPIYPGVLSQLIELRHSLRIQLLVDNEQQIAMIEKSGVNALWDIFIKLDVGSQRAGVTADSPALHSLVKRVEASSAVRIFGFYCHAGHSYGGRSQADAEETLRVELSSVLSAAALLPKNRQLIVSVGSTPTAHVVQSLQTKVPENIHLELHAGRLLLPVDSVFT